MPHVCRSAASRVPTRPLRNVPQAATRIIPDLVAAQFSLAIPRFIAIGHGELDIDTVVEDNGILSWVSSDISESEETEKVLSAGALAEYIVRYDDLLRDQTEFFYSSIIRSIDPTIDLVFVYGT